MTEGGLGAFQLAIRYSRLNLAGVRLLRGDLSVGTIALNWYLAAHARLMLDLNTTRAETAGVTRNDNVLGGRVQIDR